MTCSKNDATSAAQIGGRPSTTTTTTAAAGSQCSSQCSVCWSCRFSWQPTGTLGCNRNSLEPSVQFVCDTQKASFWFNFVSFCSIMRAQHQARQHCFNWPITERRGSSGSLGCRCNEMDTSFQSSGPQDLGRWRFPADVGCFVKMLIWPMSSLQLLDFLPSFPQDGQQTARQEFLFLPFLIFRSNLMIISLEVRGQL